MAAPPSPWLVEPCPPEEADRLAEELGVRRTTAEVLIRRGHSTADAARAFLEQDGPAHDPLLLGDMAAACERIESAIAAGEKICVHGDYDADGICATALALIALRGLGAQVEQHLPSRFAEGYGLAVVARIPIETHPHAKNLHYLKVKKSKMGHMLEKV